MDYGMYSDAGNRKIQIIVTHAKANHLSWKDVYTKLVSLSQTEPEVCGEALDTVVREEVYAAIGAEARGEDFFV